MDLGLKDKSVIVLASSTGLGKAIACEFAREQARVMLFGTSEDRLKNSQADIKAETGHEPEYFVGDVTKTEDIKQLVATAAKKFGGVYALVNNTGGPPAGTFDAFDDEAWQKAYELTLLAYIRAIREVLPHLVFDVILDKSGVGQPDSLQHFSQRCSGACQILVAGAWQGWHLGQRYRSGTHPHCPNRSTRHNPCRQGWYFG